MNIKFLAEIQWNKLGAYLKETQILGSIQNTLYWDQNTGMPKKGASWRSEQLTYIAKVLHKRNSSEEFLLCKIFAIYVSCSDLHEAPFLGIPVF